MCGFWLIIIFLVVWMNETVDTNSSLHGLCFFCTTKKAMRRSEVTSDDVYILDKGNFIFQFNGNASSKDEKFKVGS